jgi:hypothetical protein
MFNNVSKAGVGMYVTGVMLVLHFIGIDVDEAMVTEVILSIGTIASFALWVWGQLERKDLRFGLFRER